MPEIKDNHFTSFDNDKLGLLCWKNTTQPEIVIIATHGINGTAQDYEDLADFLLEKQPNLTIYAYQTRGQGNDTNRQRRGDICNKDAWFKDLLTLTELVKKKHPEAYIVWCGESMGSIITTHTYAKEPLCDAIILLAPVVKIEKQLPKWQLTAAKCVATLFPKFRIKITALANNEPVQVTQGSTDHDTQASTNSYNVEKMSLRLFLALGDLIDGMMEAAKKFEHPVIVLNGGKDYFTPPEYAEEFVAQIPQTTEKTHSYWENSYHLLMYDDYNQEIFLTISDWIDQILTAHRQSL